MYECIIRVPGTEYVLLNIFPIIRYLRIPILNGRLGDSYLSVCLSTMCAPISTWPISNNVGLSPTGPTTSEEIVFGLGHHVVAKEYVRARERERESLVAGTLKYRYGRTMNITRYTYWDYWGEFVFDIIRPQTEISV